MEPYKTIKDKIAPEHVPHRFSAFTDKPNETVVFPIDEHDENSLNGILHILEAAENRVKEAGVSETRYILTIASFFFHHH